MSVANFDVDCAVPAYASCMATWELRMVECMARTYPLCLARVGLTDSLELGACERVCSHLHMFLHVAFVNLIQRLGLLAGTTVWRC